MTCRVYELGPLSRARVWHDELPDLALLSPESEGTACQPSVVEVLHRRVAVELYLPSGARTQYGLLSAEFESVPESSKLLLNVGRSDTASGAIPWALASQNDRPICGLAEEFRSSIRDGALGLQGRSPATGQAIFPPRCVDGCWFVESVV